MTQLPTPQLSIKTLHTDFVDISWKAIPLTGCNTDPGERMLYSVWFNGHQQADRESTHADFDDLKPGTEITVEVRAIPRPGWSCIQSQIASITFKTPISRDARLNITTAPQGALVMVNRIYVGTTNLKHSHPMSSPKEKVAVILHRNHFKNKTFNKTLRSGLAEYAMYRLIPKDKLRGRTHKDRCAGEVTFTFTVTNADSEKLTLLNQTNGQIKSLTTNKAGKVAVTISYNDIFFQEGKQKLVCVLDNSADQIRSFKTITIRR